MMMMIYRGDYPERTEEEEQERQRKLDEAGERKFEERHEEIGMEPISEERPHSRSSGVCGSTGGKMSDRQPWELTKQMIADAVNKTREPRYAVITADDVNDDAFTITTAAQKRLVEYILKWGRWEDSWHFILTRDKVDILKTALGVKE